FLGLTARSDGNRARARLTSVQEAVSAAHTAIAEAGGKPVSVHRTQHSLAREDVDDLQACYQYIREAFAEELSHLLAR
ncbi:MAG: hypothetical protein U9R79_01265, partial [Armatimonadota bacterium]|nr:hypothetical protein [Armatimonadota bacterium]